MINTSGLIAAFQNNSGDIGNVVDFVPGKDKIVQMDFTNRSEELTDEIILDNTKFSDWVNLKLTEGGALYGVGGYNEHRSIYRRSNHFDAELNEPRRLHLGTDIWGVAGTTIYSPIDASVHSFKYNDNFGDYGATIILTHKLNGIEFHTLYGHLNLKSLGTLLIGQHIPKGSPFAEFGPPAENGGWPPHLHFQIILDMQDYFGDYPGVCKVSESDKYLSNSPDPQYILAHTFD